MPRKGNNPLVARTCVVMKIDQIMEESGNTRVKEVVAIMEVEEAEVAVVVEEEEGEVVGNKPEFKVSMR